MTNPSGDHVVAAATLVTTAVAGIAPERRQRQLPGSTWTARRTVDHIADALVLYGRYVGTRATGRVEPLRDGRPAASFAALCDDVVDAASVLARLIDGMGDGELAHHPAGAADASGWAAMACDEIMVHGHDVCEVAEVDLQLPPDLIEAVLARLFPWAPPPTAGTPLERLLWCNGRTALPGHPRQDELWYWWSRPLDTWNGVPHRRQAPPAW
ncbi:MAG: hypothetical protein AAFN30_01125 [Actinomycetota bacterium]